MGYAFVSIHDCQMGENTPKVYFVDIIHDCLLFRTSLFSIVISYKHTEKQNYTVTVKKMFFTLF